MLTSPKAEMLFVARESVAQLASQQRGLSILRKSSEGVDCRINARAWVGLSRIGGVSEHSLPG
jgi:hypothetical protein